MRFFARLRSARCPFTLSVEGAVVGEYRTYAEALEDAHAVDLDEVANYSVDERIGDRKFNKAFGYQCGTTSTADLAAMGVPIHPPLINSQPL